MDLGVGTHEYKLRFADGEDTITWGGLIARNRRWAATRAELAPRVLRYRAKRAVEALPEPVTERVAAAVRARRGELTRRSIRRRASARPSTAGCTRRPVTAAARARAFEPQRRPAPSSSAGSRARRACS